MTKIEWTDATWNPLVGCSLVSPACTNCYAMAQAARIERMSPGLEHYRGLTQTVNGKPVWTGKVALAPEAKLLEPLRWRKPRRIFVNSMSDLFHESAHDHWIDRIFAVMALAEAHTFQVLTKRPARMREYMTGERVGGRVWKAAAKIATGKDYPHSGLPWPLPNVWLGVTAEDQPRADERIPELLATPAAVRFVSVEPMLGALTLGHWLKLPTECEGCDGDGVGGRSLHYCPPGACPDDNGGARLDWIICGGESGPGARPMHPDWARSLRDQCAAAGVAFFFKQWGDWAPPEIMTIDGAEQIRLHHRAAREPHLVHVFDDGVNMGRVGKACAGRLLDGREHNDFPGART